MDFKDIYEKYDEIKEMKDYIDYENEMTTNRNILNSYPFEEETAKNQISYLVNKYKDEINAVAYLFNNGMYTTENSPAKNQTRLWNDLNYLNNLIPLFALERTALSHILKDVIDKAIG